jgi:hypothetical protein
MRRPSTTPKLKPSKPVYIVPSWLDVSMYQNEPTELQHFVAWQEEREALLQMPLASVRYHEVPEEDAQAMRKAEAEGYD